MQKHKYALLLSVALFVGMSSLAKASVVSVGYLTRDTSQSVITDSLNQRDWLGWDVTKGMAYADTVVATGIGGAFEGFSIAHNADAQLFVNSIFGTAGTSGCTVTNFASCGSTSGDLDSVVGENYANGFAVGTSDADLAFFLSDNGTGQEVGTIFVFTSQNTSSVFKSNEAFALPATGAASTAGGGWLLYRSSSNNAVPEPGTLALILMALGGLLILRRRKTLDDETPAERFSQPVASTG